MSNHITLLFSSKLLDHEWYEEHCSTNILWTTAENFSKACKVYAKISVAGR